MSLTKFSHTAMTLALAAQLGLAVHPEPASAAPSSEPEAVQLQEVKGVSLDELVARPGADWSGVTKASITVTADFEEDRTLYNLDERETNRLIQDYEEELTKALERRAGITVVDAAPGAAQIRVTITDVDVALPASARSSVRSVSFSRWNGSLAIQGTVSAPGSGALIAAFEDDVSEENPFIERQSTVSVRSDMARLADRSASRVAGSLGELRGE